MENRELPPHVQAAFDRKESVGIGGEHVVTPEHYWAKVDEQSSAPTETSTAPVATAAVSPANDEALTTAVADLKAEKDAHKETKAKLTTANTDLKTHKDATSEASKLLKLLIPKKVDELKKLSEKQLGAIAKTFGVAEGLSGDEALQAISTAVHG